MIERSVGVDLGLKDFAATSDARVFGLDPVHVIDEDGAVVLYKRSGTLV